MSVGVARSPATSRAARETAKMFIARVERRPPLKSETIHLRIRESEEHLLNPETCERVGEAAASHGNI